MPVGALVRQAASAKPVASWPALPPRYRIVQELGRGVVGVAYLAHDVESGWDVVIKQSRRGGLRHEAAVMRSFIGSSSDHLPKLLDAFDTRDGSFLVMERGGRPLHGPMPQGRAVAVAMNLLRGLASLHARGWLHHDIHPGNVLMEDDDPATVLLIDYGYALPLRADGTWRQDVTTLERIWPYVPPEQLVARIELDRRSEIWRVGALLFTLLTGERPIQWPAGMPESQRTHAVWRQQQARGPDLAKVADPRLRAIIARAMAFDRSARYPDVGSLLDALRPLAPPQFRTKTAHPERRTVVDEFASACAQP